MFIKGLLGLLTFLLFALVQAQPTTATNGQRGLSRSARSFKRSLCSTNAECLRKGLPLIKPVKRGTKTRALRPRQSESADATIGSIQVLDVDNNPLGYISKTLNDDGGYDITTDMSQAVTVSFSQDGTNAFSLLVSSADRQARYPYLGAVFNGGPSKMDSTESSAFALLSGISQYRSGPGSKEVDNDGEPTGGGNTRQLYGDEETSVFLYNPTTQIFSGQWTDPDGTKVDTVFFQGLESNYGFGMIQESNYPNFRDNFGVSSRRVILKYVDLTA